MNGKELILALGLIEKEKGIDKEVIFEAIENSLVTACKKQYGNYSNIRVEVDRQTGEMKAYAQREVVEEVFDDFIEISLEDAVKLNPAYELGDLVDKLREAEREKIFSEFAAKERECDTAIVQRVDGKGNVIVKLGKMDAVLSLSEQIPGETYNFNDRIKVYILKVVRTNKDPQIKVSRTHYELIKRLFELESPEVYDGTVEIKGIAREAGSRAKMAVYSNVEGVDAVGACVGQNGSRVDAIVNELNGEKIDIIPWSDDPSEYIASALRPSKVIAVEIVENEDEKSAKVVVPDSMLSLAIGKEGQNVRLAAKLTGWKIDIKSETQARSTDFIDFSSIDKTKDEDSDDEDYDEEDYDEEDYDEEDYDEEDYEDEDYEDEDYEDEDYEDEDYEDEDYDDEEEYEDEE